MMQRGLVKLTPDNMYYLTCTLPTESSVMYEDETRQDDTDTKFPLSQGRITRLKNISFSGGNQGEVGLK